MIEGQGLFNLAARSAAYSSLSRQTAAGHNVPSGNVFAKSDKPGVLGSKDLNSLTVDANTTIRAMFQKAWDKLHEDGNMISDDMIKRLEKASKSDNKEIAAERLRQAKAKLRSLRLQAQVAAASGDAKQLKRIAQQAAQAAREVAGAARGLAEGIASSAATADGSASGAVPMTVQANGAQNTNSQDAAAKEAAPQEPAGAAATSAAVPTTAVPASATGTPATQPMTMDEARDALRKLGDETRAAIAQARGIIAFAAQAARAKRKHGEGDDDSFRQLQQMVSEAEKDLNSTLNDATTALNNISGVGTAGGGDAGVDSGAISGMDTVSAVTTTTIAVQVTTEVTFTASVVV
jgi:hypothetical protein